MRPDRHWSFLHLSHRFFSLLFTLLSLSTLRRWSRFCPFFILLVSGSAVLPSCFFPLSRYAHFHSMRSNRSSSFLHLLTRFFSLLCTLLSLVLLCPCFSFSFCYFLLPSLFRVVLGIFLHFSSFYSYGPRLSSLSLLPMSSHVSCLLFLLSFSLTTMGFRFPILLGCYCACSSFCPCFVSPFFVAREYSFFVDLCSLVFHWGSFGCASLFSFLCCVRFSRSFLPSLPLSFFR